jgi:arylsulfatase A-like enzyme
MTGAEAGAQASPRTEDPRPNVVIIMTDDQGWGDLGAFGHPHIKTPHLDALARGGMRLTNFYANSPVCSPTRAAYYTGKMAPETGVHYAIGGPAGNQYNSVPWLSPDHVTINDVFRAAGYRTGHFGKWHLGWRNAEGEAVAPHPSEYGVDESFASHNVGAPVQVQGERLTNGNKSELIGRRTVEFIERNKHRPFLAHVWIMDPHAVLDPSQEAMDPFMDYTHRSQSHYRSPLTIYYATIANIDRAVGAIVEKLKAEGLYENTIILFTSDNGPAPMFADSTALSTGGQAGPFRGVKASLYEGGIRVPFIAHWPGRIPAGLLDEETIMCTADFMPTLADLLDLHIPAAAEISGESLAPIFRGQPAQRENPIFWEYRFGNWGRQHERSPRLAIRDGDWKLLLNPDRSRVELFNLREDITETANQAKFNPEKVAELEAKLMAWWNEKVPDHHLAPAGSGQRTWNLPRY